MSTLKVRGFSKNQPQARHSLLEPEGSAIELVLAQEIELADASRDAGADDIEIGDEEAPAIVEVEFDDGVQLWLRPSELKDASFFSVEAAADDTDALRLAARPDATRGGRGMARLLRVFRAPARKVLTRSARAKLLEKLESQAPHAHGLYRVSGSGTPRFEPFHATQANAGSSDPWLLMIHGTASTTEGSFGDLWNAGGGLAYRRLQKCYSANSENPVGDRILTSEHRTLTQDPIDNAIDIVRALPRGAHLHLLTHSRGGLIGELLSRKVDALRYYDEADMRLFERAAPDSDAGERLRRLDALLQEKRIVVERFVRVACPARGTTLASGRLERWLSVILNLLRFAAKAGGVATGLALHPSVLMASDLLKNLLLDLVDIDDVPGLKAMDPASPLIRGLVNASEYPAPGQLMVVAGRCRGNGVLARLGSFLVDVFFSNHNDLVVDTPSMFGGALRRPGDSFRFLQVSDGITHFAYFRHPATVERIVGALESLRLQAAEFEAFDIDQSKLRSEPIKARVHNRNLDPKPPICMVVPGIMGSHLRVRDKRVWLHYRRLIGGRFGDLAIDTDDVVADEIDGGTYRSIVDSLAQSHEVIPFPYDWRLPIEDSGRRLNELLMKQLETIDRERQPIRIVAHSMGGLVARSMMLESDSAWTRMCEHPGTRLLMMGTPNQGSHAISLLLTGQERLLRLLALVDIGNNNRDMVSVAAGFGGALDMLPTFDTEAHDRDYFASDAWNRVLAPLDGRASWPRPSARELARARVWRDRLNAQHLDPERVFYVAGIREATPSGISIDPSGKKKPVFRYTTEGDGRVPWAGGIPDGVLHWFVRAVHGDIPGFRKAHAGYLDILESGKTDRLRDLGIRASRTLRSQSIDDQSERPLEDAYPSYLPDAEEIMRAAMGSERIDTGELEASPPPLIDVKVIWGNLAWSRFPLMVGHYSGDSIFSAEAALDKCTDGELSRRHALGIYPGPIGSALVIRRPDRTPGGAIVVGLGSIGDLSPGTLTAAVRSGVLQWAADELSARRQSESRRPSVAIDDTSAGLALLVIGGGAGGLSLRDAGRSLLAGIDQALLQLNDTDLAELQLRCVEFIEIFEDRAHTFWTTLYRILASPDGSDPLRDRFRLHSELEAGTDGRRRLVIEEPDGWWSPLRIGRHGETFSFERISDRARAEHRIVGTQLEQIRSLVRRGMQSTRRDPELEITLFELLIPNELKEAAPRLDAMRLLLDSDTAWIPWEMLTDRDSGRHCGQCGIDPSAEPQSVRTGMIRQLIQYDPPQRLRASESRCALVIGDPKSTYAELPGARHEALVVGALLGTHGYTAEPLLTPTSDEVLRALFRCGYRIIHLAGHGVEDAAQLAPPMPERYPTQHMGTTPEQRPVGAQGSGFVIGEHDAITYRHIAQLREVPELVFINCCHLGHVKPKDYPGMAAHFGEQFIKQGVRAVVAAGWAVQDHAAVHFAQVFYRLMLAGTSFGDAVREARHSTFSQFPDSNTWAAYQCYGDPGFRLKLDTGLLRKGGVGTYPFASRQHMTVEGIQCSRSVDDLAEYEAMATQRWSKGEDSDTLKDALLLYELATRCQRLGDLERARTQLWAALNHDHASLLPQRALEQYVNLEVRLCTAEAMRDPERREASLARIRNARSLLAPVLSDSVAATNTATALPDRNKRCAILASSYKREALLLEGTERIAALERAIGWYERQAELPGQAFYGRIQAAMLHGAIASLSPAKVASEQEKISLHLLKATYKTDRVPSVTDNLWDRIARADRKLTEHFLQGEILDEDATHLIEIYKDASAIARDQGAMRTVTENISFMIWMLRAAQTSTKTQAPRAKKFENLTRRLSNLHRTLGGGPL